MSKPKFPISLAWDVYCDIRRRFEGRCLKLIAAGSLRRRKAEVGDLEMLFIPRLTTVADPQDMFGSTMQVCDTDILIGEMLADGTLSKRPNVDGGISWGSKNKLAIHVPSGLPVDLFTASKENWINYLVCRTGGAETNKAICNAAIARGLKWCPYDGGYVPRGSEWEGNPMRSVMQTEEQVFSHVGLPFLPPPKRR